MALMFLYLGAIISFIVGLFVEHNFFYALLYAFVFESLTTVAIFAKYLLEESKCK